MLLKSRSAVQSAFRNTWIRTAMARSLGTKITVSPNPALVDDPLAVKVEGLQPRQEVTLRSRLAEGSHRFYGYAYYQANRDGIVDVTMAAKGGTYTGTFCRQSSTAIGHSSMSFFGGWVGVGWRLRI